MEERIRVFINDAEYFVDQEYLDYSLLRYLREVLLLTGSKCGCDKGQCGSCNVLIEGECKRSCLFKMRKLNDKHITTIEGLAKNGRLHPVQESFIKEGVMQCGYCTPGQIIAVVGLLNKTPDPTREDIDKAFRGVLCRCGSYPRVLNAINRAATILRGEKWEERDLSSDDIIGSSYPMFDAEDKVTGKLKFVDDYYVPGMLCGRIIFSEKTHAKILSLDKSEAEKMPGVALVMTHEDVHDHFYGPAVQDQPLLAIDEVRSIAEPIAVVWAETQDQADAAAKAVKITYEDLPAIYSPLEAIKDGSTKAVTTLPDNLTAEWTLSRGDVDKALAESYAVVEGDSYSQRIDHVYIETEGAVTIPHKDGTFTSYSNTQGAFNARDAMEAYLKIPGDMINMVQVQNGGSFGGKSDNLWRLLSLAASQITGRPTRLHASREESMRYHAKRHPFYTHYTVGADEDGKLTAVKVDQLADGGAYTYYSKRVTGQSLCYSSGPYYVPALDSGVKAVFTNNVSSGAMRGYGAPQCILGMEICMDKLAEKLNMDPIQLRRINAIHEGQPFGDGEIADSGVYYAETLEALDKLVKDQLLPMKEKDPSIGIGIASGWRHTGGGLGGVDEANCTIDLNDDGTVTVRMALAEMGNESQVGAAQLIAKTLDIPFESVRMQTNETAKMPWGPGVMASRGLIVWGSAGIKAAESLKQIILEKVGLHCGIDPAYLSIADGCVWHSDGRQIATLMQLASWVRKETGNILTTTVKNTLPRTWEPLPDCNVNETLPKEIYKVHPTSSYTSLAVAIRIDEKTGKIKVLKMIEVLDVGNIINRDATYRQAEGGLLMGLGQALDEEFVIENGVNVTDSLLKHKMIDMAGTPDMDIHFVKSYDPNGPMGAKGIGEIAMLPVMPAISNAYYSLTGKRVSTMPIHKHLND